MYKIRIFFPKTEAKAAANLQKTAVNRKYSPADIGVYNGQSNKNRYKNRQNIAVKPQKRKHYKRRNRSSLDNIYRRRYNGARKTEAAANNRSKYTQNNAAKIPSNIRKSDIPAVCQNCDVPLKSTSRFATLTGPGSKSGLATAIEAACQTASQNSADIKFTISFFLNYPK